MLTNGFTETSALTNSCDLVPNSDWISTHETEIYGSSKFSKKGDSMMWSMGCNKPRYEAWWRAVLWRDVRSDAWMKHQFHICACSIDRCPRKTQIWDARRLR